MIFGITLLESGLSVCLIHESIEGSGLSVTWVASANQNVSDMFRVKYLVSGLCVWLIRKSMATEKQADSEQYLQNKYCTGWHTFSGQERYQLQSGEADYIQLNTGIRLKSSYIPPVNTAHLHCNYRRWNWELSYLMLSWLLTTLLLFFKEEQNKNWKREDGRKKERKEGLSLDFTTVVRSCLAVLSVL